MKKKYKKLLKKKIPVIISSIKKGILFILRILKVAILVILKIIKALIVFALKVLKVLIIAAVVIWLAWWLSLKPSLYRDWEETESVLSEISFNENIIDIKNIRNFDHVSLTESKVWYYDKSFNLDEIESLYYIVEPFSDFDWPAHTMISFGFTDWSYVVVSAELRKEKWEHFDPLLWLLNQYELVYIIWDENDLVKLRSNIRKDIVRLYPMKASKEEITNLFTSALHRADKLSKEPEFYNTFWNTCTTSILKHVNSLRDNKISGFDMRILLPSNSDRIAFEEWLIDTTLGLETARDYYDITELSNSSLENSNYSSGIRKEIK